MSEPTDWHANAWDKVLLPPVPVLERVKGIIKDQVDRVGGERINELLVQIDGEWVGVRVYRVPDPVVRTWPD